MAAITFIGLGNMGGPMASNLLKAGHDLTVFDLSESAVKALVDEGAATKPTVLEAVEGAQVVISMLPAGQHVRAIYLGDQGLLAHLPASTLVIDSSTIDPDTSREVAAAAVSADITFMDAPVSGGVAGAKAGKLTFICGGEADAFERAHPILENMGKNVFHAGPSGSGQMAKICNNMLLAIQMAGTSEALALGVKNGLDPAVLSEIMQQSSGGNWVLNGYNPWPGVMEGVPASRDYAGGFLVNLMTKDLGLAMDNATANHSPVPMGALARNLFEIHAGQGNGQLDFSSIQRFYRSDVE